VARTEANGRLNFLGGARKNDGAGKHAEVGKPVALVGLQLAFGSDEAIGTEDGAQLVDLGLGKHFGNQLTG